MSYHPQENTLDDLANRFVYHPPSKQRAEVHDHIRTELLDMARHLDTYVPDSREKSLAITKLEECMFWSNAAIARNP